MAAQSLYRKYRPQRFSELVGQEHVTTALRNAVKDERVGHAYLFSGPRGTGKTTTARILAKALNCTNLGADGEPCGVCDSCLSVVAGNALDVIEIDAASNNRVEEVRELIERVAYRAAGGGRKVYIIDEVHELTDRASNALLKTLEEPPDHVVFVLATTNPEKVLPTIRSRTQHFEFTLLSTEQLEGHMADVLTREGVEFEPAALDVIARRGAGSARDSLSLLDQALAVAGGALTEAEVASIFGGTPFASRMAVLDAIAEHNAAAAIIGLGELFDGGHDPRRVAEDLLRAVRDAFLLEAAPDAAHIDRPADEQAGLAAFGAAVGGPALARTIETLGQAVVDMRGTEAADPRLVLEVAVVRLARSPGGSSLDGLEARIAKLERGGPAPVPAPAASVPMATPTPRPDTAPPPAPAVETPRARGSKRPHIEVPGAGPEPAPIPAVPPPAGDAPEPMATTTSKPALGALRRSRANAPDASADDVPGPSEPPPDDPAPRPAAPAPMGPVDLDDVVLAWAGVLDTLPPATRSAVQEAQPVALDGDILTFAVPPALLEAAKPRFQKARDEIRGAIAARVGGAQLRFKIVAGDGLSPPPSRPAVVDVREEPPPLDPEIAEIDTRDLVDAPDAPVKPSAVALLEEQLGATVVDERPRE